MVKRSFQDRPWVSEIKLIPSAYLRAGGGFGWMEAAGALLLLSAALRMRRA